MERIRAQIAFILEIDKLKSVFRRNYLSDGSRVENDAEHSWFFAMAALILQEHAVDSIDTHRVIEMALIHDIVEIDAGDTLIYDEEAKQDQAAREETAARRLFFLLPEDQASRYYGLWREFELQESPESRFARAIDRFAAIILNHSSRGKAWKEHGITAERIREINSRIAHGSPALWEEVRMLIDDAVARGFLKE
ncbi:MAG: HD domain-containing protein [Spirochaetes bacterium]|nr:HD domain-containing protein [Spirochaetota bacterium]